MPRCKLIFSLDVQKKREFERWLDLTCRVVSFYKIGFVPFVSLGPWALRSVKKRKKKIFLDLKFFDIPHTMVRSCLKLMEEGIDIVDFHLFQNKENLKMTLDEIRTQAKKRRLKIPLFLGVSVLTSVPGKSPLIKQVLSLCRKAKEVGLDGVILSGREAPLVRREMGKDFKIACPGIRLGPSGDDQKRVVAPFQVKDVADFVVVGRPILESKDPLKVISKINSQLQ